MIRRETVSVAIVGVALLALVAIALSQKNRRADSRELARWHSEAMDSAEPAEEADAQKTTGPATPVERPAAPRADLPILMYHHIREFTDPDDLIGVRLTEMAKHGVEIGSHTVSHPYLSKLSAEKQRAEIADSKKVLHGLSPRPILSFSYPYGDHDDESIRALDRAGYRYAVTAVTGEATTERPLLMKRIRVPDRTSVDSLLRRVRQRSRPSTPSNSGKEAMRATAPLYSSSLPCP